MSARVFTFEPVGFDVWQPTRLTTGGRLPAGTKVRKVQPAGCPRNGTMGHTYVSPVGEPDSTFVLVLLNSLVTA